jgi:hypothetical protein
MGRISIRGGVGCALILGALVGLLIYSFSGGSPDPSGRVPSAAAQRFPELSVDMEGVRDPEMVPADELMLEDDEVVIGVVAYGQARAYLSRAFAKRPNLHVVHDQFGLNPVAVTHCDRNGCTRVFTGKQGEQALDLRCGGWLPVQEMSLRVGDREYAQSSPEIPLADLPFVVTTWKDWRQQQPGSLVYLGTLGAESD